MNEATLPSRYRIRNSIPGGLRPSTLPLGHEGSPQTFAPFKLVYQSGQSVQWMKRFNKSLFYKNAKNDIPHPMNQDAQCDFG